MRLTIHIDGACRGNPGPGSIGIVVRGPRGGLLKEERRRLGDCTNNIAEYTALSEALRVAKELGGTELTIFSDSQLLVRQYAGEYKVKNPKLKDFLEKIRRQAAGFGQVRILHVPRELNKRADKLANQALDAASREASLLLI